METISLAVAFGAGLLSFLSPCVLPLIPVYLASLVGPEIFDPLSGASRWHIFCHALCFVIGFTIVFTALGAAFGLTGFSLGANPDILRRISGWLLVAFGIFMLASWRIPWLNYEKRLQPKMGRANGYLRSLFIGAVFTIAWTPCVGPILGGILTLALNSKTAYQGAYLLAVYSLGLGLPFLVLGAAFGFVRPLLQRMQRYSGTVNLISALLLIIAGVLILTNKLEWLQGGW